MKKKYKLIDIISVLWRAFNNSSGNKNNNNTLPMRNEKQMYLEELFFIRGNEIREQ